MPRFSEQVSRRCVTDAGTTGDVDGELGEQSGPVIAGIELTRPRGGRSESSGGRFKQRTPSFVDSVVRAQSEFESLSAEPGSAPAIAEEVPPAVGA